MEIEQTKLKGKSTVIGFGGRSVLDMLTWRRKYMGMGQNRDGP